MNKITLRMLKRAGACQKQVEEFKARFGASAEVTVEACVAVAGVFDWDWAAQYLLSPSAWDAYLVARGPAWEAYKAVQRPAWEAYKAVERPALEAYLAATRPAWEAYKVEQAKAFAEAFLSEKE